MSQTPTVVPHVREFLADTLTPLGVYRRLRRLSPVRFLLESVTGGEQVSRFSFLGAGPTELLHLYPDRLEIDRGGEPEILRTETPLELLREVLGRHRSGDHDLPFFGGWVGYFGYDLARLVERLPTPPPRGPDLPVALLGRFDTVVAFDHAHQRVLAVTNEVEGEISRHEAEVALARLEGALTAGADTGGMLLEEDLPEAPSPTEVSLDGAEFRAAVRRAKEEIEAGEIFQVVLARRFSVETDVSPVSLFRALRLVNPSPYMVLLETHEASLMGASPEMLVRRSGETIRTRPIAGTRRRGATEAEDGELAEELLADPKERAEHLMLVDLGRNDLGRVAKPGSVRVSTFMEVERYSHVMHLVSGVEAELDPERDSLDALLACFPAGTVSGAPKIRAMEIIDELEPERRGPYAGAAGYLSYAGDLDTCITIRTLVSTRSRTSVTAGAGIVADSDPEREREETENKAAGMLSAVALAERLEE
ncbi:MAG: anthranilate synthase component I [Thermoanaerobaculia bacterium]|nr:anthranilate synthase component I [Thermoanaerobaculia bacterium]